MKHRKLGSAAMGLLLMCGGAGQLGAEPPPAPSQAPLLPRDAKPETPPVASGAVEGVITYRGQVPRMSLADEAGVYRELLEVDADSGGVRFVVVWLEREASEDTDKRPVAASGPVEDAPPVVMDQVDYAFMPHVMAVRVGQTVVFTNSDPANHNVRASARHPKNEFNVYTANAGSYRHRFVMEPANRPIRLGCDMHPWMRAWIYVLDHPWFAVSDAGGTFSIPHVPPGTYTLTLQQPDVGYVNKRRIVVRAGQSARIKVEINRQELKVR